MPTSGGSGPPLLVNALPLRAGGAGVSTYIRELLGALAPSAPRPLAAMVAEGSETELPSGVRAVPFPPAAGTRRALQGLRGARPAALVHGLDVDLPLLPGCPTVTTVHDLSVFDTPWAFPGRRVVGERLLVAHALARADAVIAVSAFTAERVRALFRREAVVIPEAPRSHFRVPAPQVVEEAHRRYRLPGSFVLQVGTVEPRKGVGLVAAACRRLGVPLVVAGRDPEGALPPEAQALGFVPEQDLPALYRAATVVAYVSRYEGFGLPPVEALACGGAVVSAPVPAVELLDGALVVAPVEEEALAAAIGDLLADEERRAELRAAGPRAAGTLSWETAARATLAVYAGLGVGSATGSSPEVHGRGQRAGRALGTLVRSLPAALGRGLPAEDPRQHPAEPLR